MIYRTNYKVAVSWLNNNLILCNNIFDIDDNIDYLMSDQVPDIYQYYLTDCSQSDVKFLMEHFNLLFIYSPKLDLYVLCVDHYGTSWDYVACMTDLENAKRELGESK